MEQFNGAIVNCFKDNLKFGGLLKNINLCNLDIDLFFNQENSKNCPQLKMQSINFNRKFSKFHPIVEPKKQEYSSYKYSKLLQLKIKNIDECLELQDNMISVIAKTKSRTFIRERNRQDFKNAIEKNELFGVRNKKDNKLISIIMLSPNKQEDILSHIQGKEKIEINENIAKLLELGNSCYSSCLMSRVDRNLYPKLGSYTGLQVKEIAKIKNYDFIVGEIGVENFKSYKSACNKGILTFAIGHKNVNFKNVSGNFEDLACFYSVAINNEEIANIIQNSIIQESLTPIFYNEKMIEKIKNAKKHDPILKKDEIILFKDKIPYKVKFNQELLKQNIKNYEQKKEKKILNKVDFNANSNLSDSSLYKFIK